ncbi:MAG: peptidyl-prolyl cis-trans isomerase [Clostridiales bacterium]|nr:peptidyl-prolyl cis-trans isomerase [Clostridiales bacterium]
MKISWTRLNKQSCLLGVLATLILLGSSCGQKNSSGSKEQKVSEEKKARDLIILKVGGQSYRESDFQKYVRDIFGNGTDKLEAATLSYLFDEFFESRLLVQAAVERGITVSPAEKDEYLARLERGEEAGEMTRPLWEPDSGEIADKIMIEKYLLPIVQDVRVEDSEVQRYYELHKSEFFLPDRVQASQILLPTEAEAVDIWEKVKSASEEDFRRAARAHSIGPESSNGGIMGVFQRGQLPLEMETVVFSLKEGEVSPVIESPYGFHLFRLDRKFEPEWISLEEASASIRRKLLDLKIKQAVSQHIQSLEERMEWQVFPENLPFPYQRIEE